MDALPPDGMTGAGGLLLGLVSVFVAYYRTSTRFLLARKAQDDEAHDKRTAVAKTRSDQAFAELRRVARIGVRRVRKLEQKQEADAKVFSEKIGDLEAMHERCERQHEDCLKREEIAQGQIRKLGIDLQESDRRHTKEIESFHRKLENKRRQMDRLECEMNARRRSEGKPPMPHPPTDPETPEGGTDMGGVS